MNPKQVIVSVEKGCESEGYLQMMNRLLLLVLGLIYLAEKSMRFADRGLFAFLREEIGPHRSAIQFIRKKPWGRWTETAAARGFSRT